MNSSILFLGTPSVAHRASNTIKVVLDLGFNFSIECSDYENLSQKTAIKRLICALLLPLSICNAIIKLILAKTVYVLPCNYSFSIFFLMLLARLLQKRVITDFYISLYDKKVSELNNLHEQSIKSMLWFVKDYLLLKLSTDVIFLSKSESIYYLNAINCSINQHKISIVPLCIDNFKINSINRSRNNSIQKKFHLCWWGSSLPLHGLETIILSMNYLKNYDIILTLCPNKENSFIKYSNLIRSLNLSTTISIRTDLDFRSNTLPNFLVEHCDIALGVFGTSNKAKNVMLNKIVEALCLRVPIITMNNTAISELLRPGIDLITCDNTPEKLAKCILDASAGNYPLNEIAHHGYARYNELFSFNQFKLNMKNLLLPSKS
jgi:glycosyltransferase involved in cell wall biosynthesis